MGRTVLSCGQAVFKSEYTPTTPKHLVVDFIASASEYKKIIYHTLATEKKQQDVVVP